VTLQYPRIGAEFLPKLAVFGVVIAMIGIVAE
jgi:hypothetical protein